MKARAETPSLVWVQAICVSCARGARVLTGRYREFLLAPGTLFTFGSLALLIVAAVLNPGGLVGRGGDYQTRTPFYLAAALTGSVYIWWSAIQGIRERDFTADIPVSLATAAALIVHQYSAAAVVAVLLLLGGMLEEFVAARAGQALDALARLLPDEVTVRRDGREVLVPLAEVVVDDLLLVRSGERIAVDGEIVSGSASVDEAAITGESMPVDKLRGDRVFAGTLNQVGAVEVRATRVGEDTSLGQIRRMVEAAQEQKAPIERLLNRYAKFYTPAAIALGIGLWLFTHDISRSITMLIVFCPCVMVLATPTALVASIGNAALRGSLVKKGATIEALARIDTVAFDKTGTLTFGAPRLLRTVALNGLGESDLLRLAAVAEKFSEHPVGQAVVKAAAEKGLLDGDPQHFEPLLGMGVRARIAGQTVLLGRERLLADHGVQVPGEVAEQATMLAAPGRTVITVARDQEVAGLLVLEDAVRPESAGAVRRLKGMGARTVLISGDNRVTAERIGRELGIEELHAEVLPQEKVELVRKLKAEGRKVMFVGEGVNDGPALAAADVGVAMGLGGTDIAIETAEIGLLSDDLSKLPHLLQVSRLAIRAIKQNLVFSLGVLAVAVALTIPGILTPVTGALLHEFSSIPVIGNSARLIGLREEA
jgi:Cd2+/Zn2+-exporting ATPase